MAARNFQKFTFFSPLAPLHGPEVVFAYNSSFSSLLVRWSHLPEKYFRGQPVGYNIVYNPVDSESNMNFVSLNHKTNTTTLTNLTVYTMYVINVSAVSSGGIGPANTVKARTDADGRMS